MSGASSLDPGREACWESNEGPHPVVSGHNRDRSQQQMEGPTCASCAMEMASRRSPTATARQGRHPLVTQKGSVTCMRSHSIAGGRGGGPGCSSLSVVWCVLQLGPLMLRVQGQGHQYSSSLPPCLHAGTGDPEENKLVPCPQGPHVLAGKWTLPPALTLCSEPALQLLLGTL